MSDLVQISFFGGPSKMHYLHSIFRNRNESKHKEFHFNQKERINNILWTNIIFDDAKDVHYKRKFFAFYDDFSHPEKCNEYVNSVSEMDKSKHLNNSTLNSIFVGIFFLLIFHQNLSSQQSHRIEVKSIDFY